MAHEDPREEPGEDPRGFNFEDDAPPPGDPLGASEPTPVPGGEPVEADALLDREAAFAAVSESADPDLAKMYVRREPSTDGVRLTIREGAPPPDTSIVRRIAVAAFALIFALVVLATLQLVRRDLVTPQGELVSLPLWRWAVAQVRMPGEQRALQKLSPDERAFVLTRQRIERAWEAASDYALIKGSVPRSVADLVDERMLTQRSSVDGWGAEFAISGSDGRVLVRSAGADGLPRTHDDVTRDDSGLRAPAEFVNMGFEEDPEG